MSRFVLGLAFSGCMGALVLGTGSAMAAPISVVSVTKETQAGFQALTGTGSQYNTPGVAGFPDGPLTVDSSTASAVTTGNANKISGQDSILLVLTDLNDLPAGQQITLNFDDKLGNIVSTVKFNSSDFFTTAQAGFNPSQFSNGKVNGISFTDANARHAGVDITYSGALPANTVIASVTVHSPIDLRVDIFGDKQGLLFSHNGNSFAEGVPEPSAFLVFGVGLLGLLGVRSRDKS